MSSRRASARSLLAIGGVVFLLGLAWGTWKKPGFWVDPQQHGDRLMKAGDYKEAEAAYKDPWHIGTAQYRNGDFKEAIETFARVPGATGAFNRGNAQLMHGAYDDAIKSYDRALGFKPGWKEADENKALAIARKQVIDDAGENRDQESADAYDPDQTVFDQKGDEQPSQDSKPDMNSQVLTDANLRATWLRRVQTSPADFLQAKFAYQAAHEVAKDQSDAEADHPASQDPAEQNP